MKNKFNWEKLSCTGQKRMTCINQWFGKCWCMTQTCSAHTLSKAKHIQNLSLSLSLSYVLPPFSTRLKPNVLGLFQLQKPFINFFLTPVLSTHWDVNKKWHEVKKKFPRAFSANKHYINSETDESISQTQLHTMKMIIYAQFLKIEQNATFVCINRSYWKITYVHFHELKFQHLKKIQHHTIFQHIKLLTPCFSISLSNTCLFYFTFSVRTITWEVANNENNQSYQSHIIHTLAKHQQPKHKPTNTLQPLIIT